MLGQIDNILSITEKVQHNIGNKRSSNQNLILQNFTKPTLDLPNCTNGRYNILN